MIYVVVIHKDEWIEELDDVYETERIIHAYPTKEMAENAVRKLAKYHNADIYNSDFDGHIIAAYDVDKTHYTVFVVECPFN